MNAPSPDPIGGSAAWRATRNVLVVRLDNLGDVLMTTPAIEALARSDGERRVTLLASRAGAAVKDHVAAIDDVLVYDAPWVAGPHRSGQADRRFLARLAQRRFDAAVIFTVCTQSALPAAMLCRMAGIPLRLAHARENPYALLTDWVRDDEVVGDGMRHEVERQLALVRSVGFDAAGEPRLSFRSSADERDAARLALADAGLDPFAPYVVVHPGSSAASRRWPAERFGRAAARLAVSSGVQLVFAGGAGDAADVAAAQAAAGGVGVALVGRLSLGGFAALVAGARMLVCNNSGPAHLAAASGTPVVVLYALTNPQHTPWRVPSRVLSHDVPCRNCLRSVCPERHHACLLGIDVDAVVTAATDLLRETGVAAPVAACIAEPA